MKQPIFQTISEVILFAFILVLLLLNVIGLTLTLQQQKTIAANSKIRTAQINSLQQHVDCIANFFEQTNRNDLTINKECSP